MDINFSENVRMFRTRLNMSQEALSRRTGLSRVTIARIEIGDTAKSEDTVALLAQAFGVSPAALVYGRWAFDQEKSAS